MSSLLESQFFNTPQDEINYLRETLEKERKESKKREEQLKNELEFALKSAEKLSQECDHAVLVSQKLKSIIDGSSQITENGYENDLINEISQMRYRNQKINHMNQKYRNDLGDIRSELYTLKNELSNVFEDVLISIKTVPQYALPVIKISHNIDTSKPITIIEGLKQVNQHLIKSLQEKR